MARKCTNKALETLTDDFDKCLSELLFIKDKLITECNDIKNLLNDHDNFNFVLKNLKRNIVNSNLIFQRNKTKYLETCRENDRLDSVITNAELEVQEKLETRNNLSAEHEQQRRIIKDFVEAITEKHCLINKCILHIEEFDIILRKKCATILSMLKDIEKIQVRISTDNYLKQTQIEQCFKLYSDEINILNNTIDNKNSDIEKLKKLVNKVNNELESNLNILEQTKEEIKLLDNEITELENSITKISAELSEIDSLIELNKSRLNSLEENIKDKNKEYALIKSEISSIESKISYLILGVKERQMANDEIRNKIKSIIGAIKTLNDNINYIIKEITINSGLINRRNERNRVISIKIEWFSCKSEEITSKIRNLKSLSKELNDHKYKQEGLIEESHRLDSEFYKLSIIENNLLNEIDKIKARIEDVINEKSTNAEILGDKNKILEKITEEEELLTQELKDLKDKVAKISEKRNRNNEEKKSLKEKFERELNREFEKVSIEFEEKTNKILQSMNQESDSEIKCFENKMGIKLKNTRSEHESIILEKRKVIESLEKELNHIETIEINK